MPEAATILNRPFWARVLLVFWGVEVAMGLLFAKVGFGSLGPSENGMAVLLIALGLLLALAGVVMTGLCWRIARLKGPAIEMTAEGLLDRRLAPTRIGWEHVAWKLVFNGRSHALHLDVGEPARSDLRPFWEQRAMGLFNRLFRYPEFTIVTLGTGLSSRKIATRMEAFKPPCP